MKSPLEDTIWGASYGSATAVRDAFDRFGPEYHRAIIASGVPAGAAGLLGLNLASGWRGIDLGCGSGVLGQALRERGWSGVLEGVDLSPGMLKLAGDTGCYGALHAANLLLPAEAGSFAAPYDFVITVGLIGDYVPFYLVLPYAVSLLRPGGIFGFAVESRSTPWRALAQRMTELGLITLTETMLSVPEGALAAQTYHFFVTRLAAD